MIFEAKNKLKMSDDKSEIEERMLKIVQKCIENFSIQFINSNIHLNEIVINRNGKV
jgi:hypothetical protein